VWLDGSAPTQIAERRGHGREGVIGDVRGNRTANHPAAPSKYPLKRSHSEKGSAQRFLVLSPRFVPAGLSIAYPLPETHAAPREVKRSVALRK
jgi:hypothetical protein